MKKILFFCVLNITLLFTICFNSFAGNWEQEDNKWKYKENDDYIYGESKQIDGVWYFFDDDGYMATGLFDYDEKCYHFDENGKPDRTPINYKGKTYETTIKGEIKGMSVEELTDYRDTLSSQYILGGGSDADLQQLLNIGTEQAKQFLNDLPLSINAFKTIFKIKSFNDEAIEYMLTASGINRKQQALKCGKELFTMAKLDRIQLKTLLLAEGFTNVEASFGTEMTFVEQNLIAGTKEFNQKQIRDDYLNKMSMIILGQNIVTTTNNSNQTQTQTQTQTQAQTQAYDPNTYRIISKNNKFAYLHIVDDDEESGKFRVKISASLPTFEGPRATELNSLIENNALVAIKNYLEKNDYDNLHKKNFSGSQVQIVYQNPNELQLQFSGNLTAYITIDLNTMTIK